MKLVYDLMLAHSKVKKLSKLIKKPYISNPFGMVLDQPF